MAGSARWLGKLLAKAGQQGQDGFAHTGLEDCLLLWCCFIVVWAVQGARQWLSMVEAWLVAACGMLARPSLLCTTFDLSAF